MANGSGLAVNRIGGWLGIVVTLVALGTSAVNIWLSIHNAGIEARVKSAEQQIQADQLDIERQRAELEKSKEKTSRLTFVSTLIPKLLDKEAKTQVLHLNLIRLALFPSEFQQLSEGYSQSEDPQLRQIGETGNKIIGGITAAASAKEREGFEALVNGDYDAAILAFEAAETIYPSFHHVYELARTLRTRRQDLNDQDKGKEVLRFIANNYSAYAPTDVREKLKAMTR